MMTLLAAMFGALTVFVAIGALTGQLSFSQRRLAARTVMLSRQTDDGSQRPRRNVATVLKDDTFAGSATISALLRRFSWFSSRAEALDRGSVPLKVSEYLLILLLSTAGVGLLAALLSGLWVAGVLFGIGTFFGIEQWVRARSRRRLAAFNRQLPIALQVMATSLRSGFGVMEAVQTVGREMDQPLSGEFAYIIDQARVGGSFEAGMANMVNRVDSDDLRIVARALEIHRKVGGDLAAILDSVSNTMREREELRGHITALTAQQRFGGMVVGVLPVWVVGFFLVANPDFISPLWEESIGRLLLLAGGAMEVVAFIAMRRIMTIEV